MLHLGLLSRFHTFATGRFGPLALVAALALSVVGTTFGYLHGQPDVYTSRAILSLSPRQAGQVGADNVELAASRYVAYLSAASTLDRAAADIGEPVARLRGATEVAVQPNTVTILVSVTLPDAVKAARAANAIATVGLRTARADELVSLDLIAPGVVAKAPSGPKRQLIMIGGIGAAVGLAVLAIAALGYFRDSPVLGGGSDPLRIVGRHRRDEVDGPPNGLTAVR